MSCSKVCVRDALVFRIEGAKRSSMNRSIASAFFFPVLRALRALLREPFLYLCCGGASLLLAPRVSTPMSAPACTCARPIGLGVGEPAAARPGVVLLLLAAAPPAPAGPPPLVAAIVAAAPTAKAPARMARSSAAVVLGVLAAPSIASAGTSAPFAGLTALAPFRRRAM